MLDNFRSDTSSRRGVALMEGLRSGKLDYDRPIKVAENIYWMGAREPADKWMINPYLIVDQGEAILVDAGSGTDFTSLVMKIVQIGIAPSAIKALVYQNYDPRLWGSLQYLEAIINRKDLKIISDRSSLVFGQHHAVAAALLSLEDVEFQVKFSSGRSLELIKTPFAGSAGSFVTFDRKSGILFSGHLFSSYSCEGEPFLELMAECADCKSIAICPYSHGCCPVHDIVKFHRDNISSERALKYALECIASVPFRTIAPQQGSVIRGAEDIAHLSALLASLKGVGIDGIVGRSLLLRTGGYHVGERWIERRARAGHGNLERSRIVHR